MVKHGQKRSTAVKNSQKWSKTQGFAPVGIFSKLLPIRHICLNRGDSSWFLFCNMECGEHYDYSQALTLGVSQKALMVQEKIKFYYGW